MKKYKLIKEYPGSPKLGTEIEKRTIYADKWMFKRDCNLFPVTSGTPDDYPEFWEEVIENNNPLNLVLGKTYKIRYKFCTSPIKICKVDRFTQHGYPWSNSLGGIITDSYELIEEVIEEVVEKDYEILSFYYNDRIFSKLHPKSSESLPYWSKDTTWIKYDDRNCKIHSVKRLLDGEIFTVGDKVSWGYEFNITEISLQGKYCYVNSLNISMLPIIKKPLFTVEKDYEILSIKCNIKGFGDYILNKLPNGKFANEYKQIEFNSEFYDIHSVKRKSDGEVFTIGDKAITKYSNYGNITEFELKYNKIYITTKSGKNKCYLDDLKPIKKPFEKDYEILSFKTPNNTSLMVGKTSQGWFTGVKEVGNNDFRSEEWLIKHNYLIESIRRLSDGEVFTVGDKVVHEYYKGNPKIEKIYFIEKDRLSVYIGGGWNVSIAKIEKVKNPLFRTEDGIDIYEGDSYVTIKQHGYGKKYFSTKEAAEEYVLMNKPSLSIKEIAPLFGQYHLDNSISALDRLTTKLKELVKSKL